MKHCVKDFPFLTWSQPIRHYFLVTVFHEVPERSFFLLGCPTHMEQSFKGSICARLGEYSKVCGTRPISQTMIPGALLHWPLILGEVVTDILDPRAHSAIY